MEKSKFFDALVIYMILCRAVTEDTIALAQKGLQEFDCVSMVACGCTDTGELLRCLRAEIDEVLNVWVSSDELSKFAQGVERFRDTAALGGSGSGDSADGARPAALAGE